MLQKKKTETNGTRSRTNEPGRHNHVAGELKGQNAVWGCWRRWKSRVAKKWWQGAGVGSRLARVVAKPRT